MREVRLCLVVVYKEDIVSRIVYLMRLKSFCFRFFFNNVMFVQLKSDANVGHKWQSESILEHFELLYCFLIRLAERK